MVDDNKRIGDLANELMPDVLKLLDSSFFRIYARLARTTTVASITKYPRQEVVRECERIDQDLVRITFAFGGSKKHDWLDVAEDMYLMGHQLAVLRRSKGLCPVIVISEDIVPVLISEFSADPMTNTANVAEVRPVARAPDGRPRAAGQFGVGNLPPADIAKVMKRPLANFSAARVIKGIQGSDGAAPPPKDPPSGASTPPGGGGATGKGAPTANVEVRNRKHGWQVVYSPSYLSQQNGFGGPSTPVFGYAKPGTYRFGIANSKRVLWDSNQWTVPTSTPIFLPLP
jgi:hypothetical protein